MQRLGGDFDYDTHGGGYAMQRRPDPRIAAAIIQALGEARTVLNVGAGAGSYEPDDRIVLAVEPSATMRAQRPAHRPAVIGVAEALPFDDASFDGAMASFSIHQWSDLRKGLSELRRVARGPVVILAGDRHRLPLFWLNDYAPELIAMEQKRYPELAVIAEAIGPKVSFSNIPVPLDCTDGLTEAFYGRPERLLDPAVRRAQSSWGFLEPGVEERAMAALKADLDSGAWDERHGHLRSQPFYEGALALITGWPA